MVGRTVIRTESFLINGPDSPDIEMADNNCFRVIMIRQMFVDCYFNRKRKKSTDGRVCDEHL